MNDNAPVMSDKRIDVSFREDIKIGSKLFQVYATDRDDPVNYGKVRFRLENEQSYYKINADTGEVFLQAMFDYETARSDEVSFVSLSVNPSSLLVEVMRKKIIESIKFTSSYLCVGVHQNLLLTSN